MKMTLFLSRGLRGRFKIASILCFILLFCHAAPQGVVAQQSSKVSGIIRDNTGEALIGATVRIKGGTTGAVANVDGEYTITVPSKQSVLIFSFMGYKTQEVTVGNRTQLNITLEAIATDLNEVVVVGYGVQKKVHVTGSVAQITAKELIKAPMANVSQALVGKLPGLITRQSSGKPGSDGATLLVRGYTSSNGSAPLILVDGVERDDINDLDPNEIETISVLKDAAAAAVYGMKAAAGVILVTTKRGMANEKPNITYSGSLTLSQNTTLPEFCNGTQYMQWYNRARVMDGYAPKFTDQEIAMTTNGDPTDGYENTDWVGDFMGNLSPMHQHNISVRGGTNTARYFVSLGYVDQRGFVKDLQYQRANLRSNIDVDITKDLLFSINVAGQWINNYTPGAFGYDNQSYNNPVAAAMFSYPFVPQTYQGYPASGYYGATNPLYTSAHTGYNLAEGLRAETSAKLEYRIPGVKGLKASMFFSYNRYGSTSKVISYPYQLMQYDLDKKAYRLTRTGETGLIADGNSFYGSGWNARSIIRPTINYNRTIGKHDIGALFLYEQSYYVSNSVNAKRYGYLFPENNDDFSLGTKFEGTPNGSAKSESAYAGFVGRLNYSYASKYLAEFSFRYDGSFRFPAKDRWGFFPSASLGWVVSEEDFFKNLGTPINRLKFRGSFGILGRDNVTAFLFNRYLSQSATPNVAFGQVPQGWNTLTDVNIYPSSDLTWEKTRTINGGFDLALWKNKLELEFDVFYKYTYDILKTLYTYPPSIGGNYPSITNSGIFDARGFEMQISHRNQINKVNYSIVGNLTFSKNRILSEVQSDNVLKWQSTLNRPIGEKRGFIATGLYQTQEQLDNAPTPPSGTIRMGDIMYQDLNGDGKLDSQDFTVIAKSETPEMMFNLSGNFEWKGIDFSVQFQGAALCDYLLSGVWDNNNTDNTQFTKPFYGLGSNTPLYLLEGSWTPDNPTAKYPRLSTIGSPNNAWNSSAWVVNGAYLRLKNIMLGYTFPKKWMSRAHIKTLRVYVGGSNLYTWTQFKYLDPESPSVNNGYYPQQRYYSFGINLGF